MKNKFDLRYHLSNFFSWIYHVGWMYLLGAMIVYILGYGIYLSTILSPVIKLSITLCGFILYNLANVLIVLVSRSAQRNNKSITNPIGCLLGGIMAITIYFYILSVAILPLFVTVLAVVHLIVSCAFVFADEKKIYIPKYLFWCRNLIFIVTIISLGYYLVQLLGYL